MVFPIDYKNRSKLMEVNFWRLIDKITSTSSVESIAVVRRHLRVVCELNPLRLQQRLLSRSRCYHRGDQQTGAGTEAGPRPAGTNQREVSRHRRPFYASLLSTKCPQSQHLF